MHNQSIEQWLKDPMAAIAIVIVLGVFAAFGWMCWVSDPRHPERMERLRKECGIIPSQSNDLSNDRNRAPRSDQK